MSAEETDDYLESLEEPKRTTLARAIRETILDVLPEAEQGISYGVVPAFKIRGKTDAGIAASSTI